MKYNGRIYKSINTCLDCPDRYPACHDHCEKYQAALAEWLDKKRVAKSAKRKRRDYDDFKINAMLKYK